MSVIIGVDSGTSGCKTIAVDRQGDVVASAHFDYPIYSERAGWAEQQPEDWWDAAARGIAAVTAQLGDTEVAAIGLSAQMHGLVALDEDWGVVRRAILWNDQRCARECDEITEEVGGFDRLVELTNNRMLPGFTGGKIRWLRNHDPESYERMRRFCLPKDYLRLRLTGVFATDESDASGTGFFDPRTRRWVPEVARACAAEPEMLPPIVPSTAQTGAVLPEIAEELGLRPGTPVFGGGGDSVIQTTAMGVTEPGDVGVTLGTAGIVATLTDSCPENQEARIQVSAGNAPDSWHVMGVALTAAGAFQWFGEVVAEFAGFEKPDFDSLAGFASNAPVGCDGLMFMPYLNGERSPHVAPEASGAFVGITRQHGPGHLARAVMEGAILNLRRIVEEFENIGIPCNRIIASGGATKNALWLSILADVCNREVVTLEGSAEGGAFGAVLAAGVGAGFWPDYEAVLAQVPELQRVSPDPDRVAVYDRVYRVHSGLFAHFSGFYEDLQELNHQGSSVS